MADALMSVVIASAQSVAKVFVIGGVGYAAVKYPRGAPFLPSSLVGTVARFTFHAFTVPLIYSSIAIAVTVESVGSYWSLLVGGWTVLAVSYMVATALHWWAFPISDPKDFAALRVAATYPNIVALPILIFPSLCEFPVVYEGYAAGFVSNNDGGNDDGSNGSDSESLRKECVAQSTTMIFCYFFAWSLAFWSFGYPQLMAAATATATATASIDGGDGNASTDDDDDGGTVPTTAPGGDLGDGPGVAATADGSVGCDDNEDDAEGENNSDGRGVETRSQHHHPRFTGLVERGNGSNNPVDGVEHRLEMTTFTLPELGPSSSSVRLKNPVELPTPRSSPAENTDQGGDGVSARTSSVVQIPTPSDEEAPPQRPTSCVREAGPSSSPVRTCFHSSVRPVLGRVWTSVRQTMSSPGFIAMMLGFLTACVPPLQQALFRPGGALRFIGSALETLGTASAPVSTMVVAASLVPPRPALGPSGRHPGEDGDVHLEEDHDDDDSRPIIDESPGMTDPNFGPYRRRRRPGEGRRRSSRMQRLGRSVRSSSVRILHAVPRSTPEMRRIHLWFNLSRLVVTPALVVGLVLTLDCAGSGTGLAGVPALAKLVVVVNSALPGALIIVVLLKAREEMADTAAAVSRVYLPNYLLSIFTIAAWTTVGLWVTLPDEDGNTLCQR